LICERRRHDRTPSISGMTTGNRMQRRVPADSVWIVGRKQFAMKSEPTESGAKILAGLVERVTFHNEENGFAVLRVKARGKRDLVTVVGRAAVISAGEFIQASGDWNNDRQHGLQFRARFLKATPPTTIEGIERNTSAQA
jgi:hypothetical protein